MEDVTDLLKFLEKGDTKATRKLLADSDDYIEATMNEVAISRGNSKHPIVKTIGAENCLILALWDKASKTGGILHMIEEDSPPNHYSVNISRFFEALQRNGVKDFSQLRVHLLGGYPGTAIYDGTLAEIGKHTNIKKNIVANERTRHTVPGRLPGFSVALDTRTGEVFNLDVRPNPNKDARFFTRSVTGTGPQPSQDPRSLR